MMTVKGMKTRNQNEGFLFLLFILYLHISLRQNPYGHAHNSLRYWRSDVRFDFEDHEMTAPIGA